MKKLFAVMSMLVSVAMVLAACGAPAAEPAVEDAAVDEPAEALRVAVVMPSAINDLAFSQSMYGALVRLQEERGEDNFEIAYSEGMFKVDEAAAALRDYAAEGYDLVIAHGSQYGASLQEIAPDFPETSFAWGTTADTFGVPNIFAYEARSEQGGYVNGVLAASLSESGIIGVVGPIEVGDAKLYVDGFTAGAKATNPDVQVNANWIGSFSDVALASEAAQTHLNAGADVLTGTAQMVVGAIGVAETNGVIWLGTQSDQSSLAPSIVAANQVYDWTVALEEIVALIGEGTLGGESFAATMSNGGLRVDYNPDFAIPDDAKAAADTAMAAISGVTADGFKVTGGRIDALAAAGEVAAAEAVFKAAFVYVAPIGDLGWTWAHDQARQQLEADLGIETAYVEMVPEGPEGERVIRDFAMKGYDLIFTTSFGYMDPTITVAEEFPDTQFVHISGFMTAPNASNVFGRMYQPRYLSGLVAGAATESNIIGYVAAFPIPEVIRGINAFTLGVREVNPDAEVRVVWTNTWFGPPEEKEAADALLAAGADIIAQHQDTTEPQKAAADAGALSIGYDSDMAQFVGDTVLTSPIWNWGVKYVEIAEQVIAGTYDGSESYWGGMPEGVVALAPLSDRVSADTAALVDEKSAAIVSGDWDVFCGPVIGANGNLVVAEGDCLDDGSMLGMDYWVAGVSGEVPGEAPGEAAVAAPEKPLVILEWSGYEVHDYPQFFPGFSDKYAYVLDEAVQYSIFADDAESLAKMSAGFSADLAHPCVNWVGLYVERGLIQPIDTSRLSNWESVHPDFRAMAEIDGEVYFVPWDWGYESILVRTDLVDEVPTSWNALWDSKYAGQVITWENDEQAFAMTALALGFDPWNTTEAESEAVKQKLIELQGNLLTYWVDYTEAYELLASGDAVMGGGVWQDVYGMLLDEGYAVEYIQPEEGRTGWVCGYVLGAESENVDLAYEFLDASISPESTAALGNEWYYGGSNIAGVEFIEDYIVEYFELDQLDTLVERTNFYPTMTEKRRKMLADIWVEVRASQ